MECKRTFYTNKRYRIGDISLGKFKRHEHKIVLEAQKTCQYTFEQGTVFSDQIDQVKETNGGTRRRRRKTKTKQSKRIH